MFSLPSATGGRLRARGSAASICNSYVNDADRVIDADKCSRRRREQRSQPRLGAKLWLLASCRLNALCVMS
jgi:hypothetical protein